jgi:hypothetical protein
VWENDRLITTVFCTHCGQTWEVTESNLNDVLADLRAKAEPRESKTTERGTAS